MSVRNQLKLLVGGLNARRSGRAPNSAVPTAMGEFLVRSRLVAALIFLATVIAMVLISSAGVSTVNVPVREGQLATTRVTALASYSYESRLKTDAAREQLRARVPQVYKLETEPLRRF